MERKKYNEVLGCLKTTLGQVQTRYRATYSPEVSAKLKDLDRQIDALLAGVRKVQGAIPVDMMDGDTERVDCDSADDSCEFETCDREPSE